MPTRSRTSPSPVVVALVVALLMTAANLFEPLAVDDVCHHYYAEQVARDPVHPFEFVTVWHQKPIAAWTVMVAPVNSYYWAPGIVLCDALLPPEWQPVGWRLWYLPLNALFCVSLMSLLRRWVRRGTGLLLAAIVLGGAVLPGVNLLLEVPMLAFGCAGLAMFSRAMDRRSLAMALVAGALWGLAFQTKYSAVALLAPWFLQALLRWRWREFVVGCAAAACVVMAIEALVALSHGGGSYFLEQLQLTPVRVWSQLVRGMFVHFGTLGAPAALLGLCGLRAPRWLFAAAVVVYLGGVLVVAGFADPQHGALSAGAPDSIAFLLMSATTWAVVLTMFSGLLRGGLGGRRGLRVVGTRRTRLFLAVWFGAELAASFVLSPFPAARRVMMMVIAATAGAGWLAVRRVGVTAAVRAVLVASIVFGLLLQAIDHLEGYAWRDAARGTAAWQQANAPGQRLYFTGGWGFEFYAPRAGLAPLLCGETVLEKGDLVAVGSIDGSEAPWFEWHDQLVEVATLEFGTDGFPLSTQINYYSGRRPFDRQHGPRYVVWIFRAAERLPPGALVLRADPWHTAAQQQEILGHPR